MHARRSSRRVAWGFPVPADHPWHCVRRASDATGDGRSLAALTADRVFLSIQRALFLLGEVAAVLAGHHAFLLTDLVVVAMQRGSLGVAHFAFLDLGVDALVLARQALVDLFTARMILPPRAVVGLGGHSGRVGHDRSLKGVGR